MGSISYVAPGARPNVEEKFKELRRKWKEETLCESSSTNIVTNRWYVQIIGLGPAALPILLRALLESHEHWNYALVAITGENPAYLANGDGEEVRYYWRKWATERGLWDDAPYEDAF